MKYNVECLYCGKKWVGHFYGKPPGEERCPICKDKNLKYKSYDDSLIDYYVGCPEFIKEKEDYSLPTYYDTLD